MRRAIGLDLNGWHDFACRDWQSDDPDEITSTPKLADVDGGFGAMLVEHDGRVMGGPQATLSPIGRGKGWGDIGAPEKRRDLASVWNSLLSDTSSNPRFAAHIRAAVDALSVHAESIMLCMPDRPEMDEARQHGLLTALRGPRRLPVTLLWRPVALVLGLLDSGELAGAEEGMRITCAVHAPDGFEVQTLVLRKLTDHSDRLAPMRAGRGELLYHQLGLNALLEHARSAVKEANPSLDARPTEAPRMPLELLFRNGEPRVEEVVRRENTTWMLVTAPSAFHLPNLPRPDPLPGPADLLLVLSPLASRHHGWLQDQMSGLGRPPHLTDPSVTARGALHAARRIERGIPHYLDQLDRISLAVMNQGGPVFEDLIPPGETVMGNREYISKPITRMVWSADMGSAEFFIRKGEHEIRHWVTQVAQAPTDNQKLEIGLRQMPAQGWAKLSVTATEWEELRREPIQLDWSTLKIDRRSADEVLEALQGPRPIVPSRVRYPAELGLWNGLLCQLGFYNRLQATRKRGSADDLKAFAGDLGRSFRQPSGNTVFAVGTDGDLPAGLDPALARLFQDTIKELAARLLKDIGRGMAQPDNHLLRSLTWTHARCPEPLQQELLRAMQCIAVDKTHPLLVPRSGKRVVMQGIGRVVTDPAKLTDLIPKLCARVDQLDWLAALSSLLSRPVETPRVLAGMDITGIAEALIGVLRNIHTRGNYNAHLKYALLGVAGLLRVREYAPWALLADRSSSAKALVGALSEIAAQIESQPGSVRTAKVKLEGAGALMEMLSGTGGRPDILMVLDQITDQISEET